jgi:signal recognition particle GTPase
LQSLPAEVERLLLRSDVSNQIARNFASNVTPAIERHVKETVTKTLIPAYTQQFSQMHQELTREMHAEMMSLKKDVLAWQGDALRSQDVRVAQRRGCPGLRC